MSLFFSLFTKRVYSVVSDLDLSRETNIKEKTDSINYSTIGFFNYTNIILDVKSTVDTQDTIDSRNL